MQSFGGLFSLAELRLQQTTEWPVKWDTVMITLRDPNDDIESWITLIGRFSLKSAKPYVPPFRLKR